ncbi:hypothetical protein BV898_07965 [Hypsibius exemplaris]|uniref:F-box domain-containing protein n=1 Tax=Hypsibius exemplaris TaxID=2072580 RepID=A0A1W0WS55_HYPEX|nr:hypothetical protein BV898_07965 [Hypsibius exemplaris]
MPRPLKRDKENKKEKTGRSEENSQGDRKTAAPTTVVGLAPVRRNKRKRLNEPGSEETSSPDVAQKVRKYLRLRGQMAETRALLWQQDRECMQLLAEFKLASERGEKENDAAYWDPLFQLEEQLLEDLREERSTDVFKENQRDCDKLIKFLKPKLTDFPDELLVRLFLYLDFGSQHKLRRVCRRWCFLLRLPEFGLHLNVFGNSLYKSPQWKLLRREADAIEQQLHPHPYYYRGGEPLGYSLNLRCARTLIYHAVEPHHVVFGSVLKAVDATADFLLSLVRMLPGLTSVQLVGLRIANLKEYSHWASILPRDCYYVKDPQVGWRYQERVRDDLQVALVRCYASAWPQPKLTGVNTDRAKAASPTLQKLVALYESQHAYVPLSGIVVAGQPFNLKEAHKQLGTLLWPFGSRDHKIEAWLAENVHRLNGNRDLLNLLGSVSKWVNPLNNSFENTILCANHHEFCCSCEEVETYKEMDGSLCHLLADCILRLNDQEVTPLPQKFKFQRF